LENSGVFLGEESAYFRILALFRQIGRTVNLWEKHDFGDFQKNQKMDFFNFMTFG